MPKVNTLETLECENRECRTHFTVSDMFVIIGQLLEQHNMKKTQTIKSSNSFVILFP